MDWMDVSGDSAAVPEPTEDPCDEHVWCYDQPLKSGDRHYSAYITTVSDTEGDRLRGRLNAAISELLRWAAYESSLPSPKDEPPS